MTYRQTVKPSWAIRAAKWLSPDSYIVMIRFNDDFEAVEVVHDSLVTTLDLLEAAQMALAKVLPEVK